MTQIYLQDSEEQETAFTLGDKTFSLRFYSFRELTYVDIKLDDEYVCAGKRVIANEWLLPSYVAADVGNIRFDTYAADAADYVWHDEFNTKFRLMAYDTDEIKDLEQEE